MYCIHVWELSQYSTINTNAIWYDKRKAFLEDQLLCNHEMTCTDYRHMLRNRLAKQQQNFNSDIPKTFIIAVVCM